MRDQSDEVMRELSDEEMKQVSGGLNAIGETAQLLGGQFLGGFIHSDVKALGGKATAQLVVATAQTPAT